MRSVQTSTAGTQARRINGQVVVILGWGRAILMQVAHPLVAAGVSQHSDYGRGLGAYLRRTHATVGSMLSLTFGRDEEIRRTAARINAIHRRVHGELADATPRFPAGTPYSATDPDLLTWVHATLVDTQLRTYELLVEPLSSTDRDRYCVEAAQVAPLLDIPAGVLPASVPELRDYLDRRHADGTVFVTPTARRLAHDLLYPGGALGRPWLGLGRLMTAGLLPPALRAAYGFEWDARRQRRLDRAARLLRTARRRLPSRLTQWPAARRAGAAAPTV